VRVLAALAAALLLVVAIAAWWLPRWLAGPDARDRLLAAARDATGRDVACDALSLALFPPRLVAKGVRIGDAAAPLVNAERVDLRLDPRPLLARRLVVESLALDGVAWRVARTKDGVELPWKRAGSDAAPPSAAGAATAGGSRALQLDVAEIAIRNSRLVWDDTAVAPPVRVELADVAGEAHGAGPGTALALTLNGTLTSGGTLRLARDRAVPGAPDLTATLDGVDLAILAPYFGKGLALAGRVGGTITARGPADALDALDAALEVADAQVRAGDVLAQGPVGVRASLRGALEALAGTFELDATRADLSAYGGAFRKPPGAPAKAAGNLVRDAAGKLGVDGVRVKIEHMNGKADVGIDGTFTADASQLRSDDLVAHVGGQPVAVALRVDGFDADPHHRAHVATKDVDARALLAALTGRGDLLEGPLTLDAELAGPLGARAVPGLAGTVDLAVGPGRIPSVSPLGDAIAALDRVAQVGTALNRKKTERRLAPFLTDRFESLGGRFEVGGGHARTDTLVVRYPGYRLELRGSIGLADQGLDARGRLVLDPAIEAALAEGQVRAGAGPRAIEIARVGGTVSHPKLELDQAGALAFAATLALAQKRDDWERKLDRSLGAGKGGEVLDALDGILGRKGRQ
jgi:uncharacterized protein involved in outer membrane biogenesis